jgi:hypothetical protein
LTELKSIPVTFLKNQKLTGKDCDPEKRISNYTMDSDAQTKEGIRKIFTTLINEYR